MVRVIRVPCAANFLNCPSPEIRLNNVVVSLRAPTAYEKPDSCPEAAAACILQASLVLTETAEHSWPPCRLREELCVFGHHRMSEPEPGSDVAITL